MQNQGQSPARIRLVSWNIEKAKRWEMLLRCLDAEPIRSADVLCLQEVDEGMARSGNRDVANEIAERLGLPVVFGPCFLEFTKGIGDELLAPGENTTAIQGNAILSRLPVLDSQNLRLPSCADHSKRPDRREGERHALIARLDAGGGRVLTVANAHLEVFTTARCRARQMKFLLSRIPAGPAVVAGDFNTNTFNRGSMFHTFQALGALLFSNVQARTMSPAAHEPLLMELESSGFSWETFNDRLPTCTADLSTLEDRFHVPRPIRDRILNRCRVLPLRLDFIAARGVRGGSSGGRTITDLPCQPSDHLPITCDVSFL